MAMKTNSKAVSGYTIEREGDQFCLYAPSGDKVADFDTRREAVSKLKEILKEESTEPKKSKAEDTAEGEY